MSLGVINDELGNIINCINLSINFCKLALLGNVAACLKAKKYTLGWQRIECFISVCSRHSIHFVRALITYNVFLACKVA